MNKKVLIVDDDTGIVDAITMILEDSGYAVDSTSKSKEMYNKIKMTRPDVIILDVLISGEDGRDICCALKDDQNMKDIPVVMISAHPSAKKNSLECGADDFLAKPFELDELLAMIARHTE